jgi:hypothetical protein
MVRPWVEERPAVERPERVLVAVLVWLMIPPEITKPWVEERPAVRTPPAKVEVAF